MTGGASTRGIGFDGSRHSDHGAGCSIRSHNQSLGKLRSQNQVDQRSERRAKGTTGNYFFFVFLPADFFLADFFAVVAFLGVDFFAVVVFLAADDFFAVDDFFGVEDLALAFGADFFFDSLDFFEVFFPVDFFAVVFLVPVFFFDFLAVDLPLSPPKIRSQPSENSGFAPTRMIGPLMLIPRVA